MFAKLDAVLTRFEELGHLLADPEIAADPIRYQKHARAYAEIQQLVGLYRRYRRTEVELGEARDLLKGPDAEMAGLAQDEVRTLRKQHADLANRLKLMLVPTDPSDEKNVVLEVRAGTGGDEATLFAAEVFRMYTRYAEGRKWRVDVTDLHESPAGGIKEVVAVVEGRGAYSRLKFESGVHRVQRVPETEGAGRVHTSAVTVAVLPEAEDVDVHIDDSDVRIDRFCSSGPGGQSVNTTYSAVRLTHLPTGLVVNCQDEKSQHKNREKAMRVMRARLFDLKQRERHEAEAEARRSQVGSGDRSEKIRTYNFPQNRVTDHRVGLTMHRLQSVLDGELDSLIDPLAAQCQAERLEEQVSATE